MAVGIMVASPTSAGAWATYCDWDPLVLIVTPAGHIVPVYDTVWTSSPLDLGLPLESYTVARAYDAAGNPVTVVHMTISVPTGLLFRYAVTDEVTTGLVGALQATDICLAALRKVRATRERPPLRAVAINVAFNGGQAYLSTLAAAEILKVGGVSARAGLAGPEAALALIAAAAVMYVAN